MYAAPLLADHYPGFRAERRYRTLEDIARLPVHVAFLAPRGLIAGVGTGLQGARDDLLHMALEGMPSHAAAEAAEAWLDLIRPVLGRAISLTARLRARADAQAVSALELAGVPGAVISRDGRLRAANDRFTTRLGAAVDTRAGRVRILHTRLEQALATLDQGAGVRSIAVAARGDAAPFAVHLCRCGATRGTCSRRMAC